VVVEEELVDVASLGGVRHCPLVSHVSSRLPGMRRGKG